MAASPPCAAEKGAHQRHRSLDLFPSAAGTAKTGRRHFETNGGQTEGQTAGKTTMVLILGLTLQMAQAQEHQAYRTATRWHTARQRNTAGTWLPEHIAQDTAADAGNHASHVMTMVG